MEHLPLAALNLSPVATALLVYGLATILGLAIASVKVRGVGIGLTGVLFAGILLSSIGLEVEHDILEFLREFGLVLFVFLMGTQLGPGFFASLRSDGLRLNLVAAAIVISGALLTAASGALLGIAPGATVGLFSGSTTNTPSLGAAQETIAATGVVLTPPELPALSYAISYPIGILGIIASLVIMRTLFRVDPQAEAREVAQRRKRAENTPIRQTLVVENQNLENLPLSDVPALKESGVVVSRVLPAGQTEVQSALGSTRLHVGDLFLAVGTREALEKLRVVVGSVSDADLSEAPGLVSTRRVVVTRKSAVGKSVGELGLEASHGVVVTRVIRSGVELVGSPDRELKFGDMLQIVGSQEGLDAAAQIIGNSVRDLGETNYVPIFIGIALGVIAGTLPIAMPGFPAPLRLGLAGGTLIVATVLARIGKIGPILFYVPDTVSTALKDLGLILFLASVGLKSGNGFFAIAFTWDGLLWVGAAVIISSIPLLTFGVICRKVLKLDYARISGVVTGSMTDPPALAFATNLCDSDIPAVTYATVYPLTMLLRIVVAQILALWLVS